MIRSTPPVTFGARLRALLLLSAFAFAPVLEAAPPAGYGKTWEDNFDGTTLNSANWTIGLRDPGSGHLVPGSAGRYLLNSGYAGYITPQDVIVSGGSLTLLNQRRNYTGTDPAGNYSYTSGTVISMHKVHFNGGTNGIYLEWRARFPSGAKVWPALWLVAEDRVWCPEWDCFEYFGYRPDRGYDQMGLHLCYDPYPSEAWSSGWVSSFDATYDCEAWHVYGFEWTPTYARWTIDGVQRRYLANNIGNSWPNEEMYIIMNNGLRTASPEGTTAYPNSLQIDYVQLYKKSAALIPNGTYKIKSKQYNRYIDSDANGAVVLAASTAYDDQHWQVTNVSGGHILIKNVRSGRYYLDSELNNVVIWNTGFTGDDAQWFVEAVGDGSYRLKNKVAGRLYLHGTSTNQVRWNTGATGEDTKWVFEQL